MKYLHSMVRITDIDASLHFWCGLMGLVEARRQDYPEGAFTLIFLVAKDDLAAFESGRAPALELTYNWDSDEHYEGGRNFGHLAYQVDDIYGLCQHLQDNGVVINRPPRDGRMAFVQSPDGISVELLQKGEAKPPAEPWASMDNSGTW